MNFEIILKNEREKSYRIISWIIIIINIIVFVALSAVTNFQKLGILFFAGLTIFSLFASGYFKNKGEQYELAGAFFFVLLGWLNTNFWWMAFIVLLFSLLDAITRRKLIVQINTERIVYPSIPKKRIEWPELSNVIFKDGLLTIDFKNNKLIQHSVENFKNGFNEENFNEFCNQQLNKSELYKHN